MPRYRFGLIAGLLALMGGLLCIGPAAAVSITPRYAHTATLMPDRTILIVGGVIDGVGTITTNVQLEAATVGSNLTGLYVARASHTATLLPNGEVLVAGGRCDGSSNANCVRADGITACGGSATCFAKTVEVYNPMLNCWHLDNTNTMSSVRYDHTATLLRTGQYAGEVLICGGLDGSGAPLTSCDIFKPNAAPSACGSAPGSFESAPPALTTGRAIHTATMLRDGRVFLAGGYNSSVSPAYTNTTEIYDPEKKRMTPGPALGQGRAYHTATMMGDGSVFIIGGFDGNDVKDNIEVYDEPFPSKTGGFLRGTEIVNPSGSAIPYAPTMPVRKMMHAITLQEEGTVLSWGGLGNFSNSYRGLSDPIQAPTGSITDTVSLGSCDSASVCTITSSNFATQSAYQLNDYAGNLHNVSGVIASGWSSYTSNPDSLTPAPPTIKFTGGTINFTNGNPAAGTGIHADLAGSTVQCLSTDSCGYVNRTLDIVGGSGTASLTVPASVTVTAAINSGTALHFNAFASGLCITQPAETMNSSSLILTLQVGGLSPNLQGATLSNVYMTLTGGSIVWYDTKMAPMYQFTIGSAQNSVALTPGGTVGADGTVSLTGTFNVPATPDVNTVALTSATCTPPIDTAVNNPVFNSVTNPYPWGTWPNNTMTGAAGNITQYGANKIYVGPINGTPLTFTADYAVSVVKSMVFSDVEQFTPGGQSPMTWRYGTHSFGWQRYGHTMIGTSGGDAQFVGGKSCDPNYWDGSCPMVPVPNQATPAASSIGSITIFTLNPFVQVSNNLKFNHANHTTTLLPSGKMLVAGGTDGPAISSTTEIFDPVAQTFTLTPGAMLVPHANHTATLLPDGRVLVAGGDSVLNTSASTLADAEIFYPDTGYWRSYSAMNSSRTYHTATLLPDGNVLVAGGSASGNYLNSTEIYYSTAMAWRSVGSMAHPRKQHTSTLLQNGKVLVFGGQASGPLNFSELYDPNTGGWTAGASAPSSVYLHTATLLPNGKVLIAGGNNGSGETDACWFYDPTLNSWSAAPSLPVARQNHTATLLPNGNVAVIGGTQYDGHAGKPIASVEIYDPNTGIWSEWQGGLTINGAQYSLPGERAYHTTTLANDGTLYAIGGYDGVNYLNTAVSHFHMAGAYDANSVGGLPSARLSSVTATDLSPFNRGETLTVKGQNFLNVTEASGGGAGSANSDQRHPIWILQSMDGSGGGSSQGNSGFIIDLTSNIYQNSAVNSWAKIDSSITITLPTLPSALPYGWYSLRVGANDQLSPAYAVQAGPHLPRAPVTFTAYPINVSTNSMTFTWAAPAGLAPGSDFDGYNVYIATSHVWTSTVDYNSTSFTLNHLTPSSTQQIMVMPYNISGDYPVLTFSATAYTLPVAPANVAIATGPGNTFFVQWSTADPNTGSPYDGQGTLYELSESLDGFATVLTTFSPTTANFAPNQPLSLIPYKTYSFRVRACNLHGNPYGECSDFSPYVSTQTAAIVYNVSGIGYATDTVKWTWDTISGATYTIVNATATDNIIASGLTTNLYYQALPQNARSVIQVQAMLGGSVGPLSNSATAYSLAAAPVFTALSCPNTGAGITTGSVVTSWNTHPGGPGPESNPVTYQVEYATGNWNRATGNWNPGIVPSSATVVDADKSIPTESAVLGNLNPAVPVYIRARALNTFGQFLDPQINLNYKYTDEWVDLVSSYDFTDKTGFTSTLPQAPTNFISTQPWTPTSVTLSWNNARPDPTRAGYPQSSVQVMQTTCTGLIGGVLTPLFDTSTGPACGVPHPGLDFMDLPFPSHTALVTNLSTWVTYYFMLNYRNPPHWEGTQPNSVDTSTVNGIWPIYYASQPGVVPGSLAINVSAKYGGSVSGAIVGLPTPPQEQHHVSFSAPGGSFPSDTVVTISTFDASLSQCPGHTLCGGDPNLTFEITANPPLQPTLPLYFTVTYNDGEPPNVAGMTDPKQAVMLRFDPTTCQCVPVRNPASPDSKTITGELNHLSIFQVGTVQPSTSPEGMRIYPNPYYTARDGWLTIDGLPAASRVRIFTLRGELVLNSSADSHGIFTWQGANRGGRAVASGVYLVVVEGNGIKAIRKLAVIR